MVVYVKGRRGIYWWFSDRDGGGSLDLKPWRGGCVGFGLNLGRGGYTWLSI